MDEIIADIQQNTNLNYSIYLCNTGLSSILSKSHAMFRIVISIDLFEITNSIADKQLSTHFDFFSANHFASF